jgi:hypothetical protein
LFNVRNALTDSEVDLKRTLQQTISRVLDDDRIVTVNGYAVPFKTMVAHKLSFLKPSFLDDEARPTALKGCR